MAYEIPPDLSAQIDVLVSSGYASPESVIREALAALEARDADLAAIREGLAHELAGRMTPARQAIASSRENHGL